MSHEIRTPLNAIIPLLDIVLSTKLAPDQQDYLQTAYKSSRELLRIVDDILDYSKLEADRLELETTAFNLRELVETVIRLMERPADAKGLRLHLHIDPAVRLPVRGDPVRLRQVLGNLLSNAIRYTDQGGHVLLKVREQDGSAVLTVQDTGVGIAPGDLPRVFDRFWRADPARQRATGGTGLGLTIAHRIVTDHGGTIDVTSRPHVGTTFTVRLPLESA